MRAAFAANEDADDDDEQRTLTNELHPRYGALTSTAEEPTSGGTLSGRPNRVTITAMATHVPLCLAEHGRGKRVATFPPFNAGPDRDWGTGPLVSGPIVCFRTHWLLKSPSKGNLKGVVALDCAESTFIVRKSLVAKVLARVPPDELVLRDVIVARESGKTIPSKWTTFDDDWVLLLRRGVPDALFALLPHADDEAPKLGVTEAIARASAAELWKARRLRPSRRQKAQRRVASDATARAPRAASLRRAGGLPAPGRARPSRHRVSASSRVSARGRAPGRS